MFLHVLLYALLEVTWMFGLPEKPRNSLIINNSVLHTLRFFLMQSNCITVINLSTDSELMEMLILDFNGTVVLADSESNLYETAYVRPVGTNYCETLNEDFFVIAPNLTYLYKFLKFPIKDNYWYNNNAKLIITLTSDNNNIDIQRLQCYIWEKYMILNNPIFIKDKFIAIYNPFRNLSKFLMVNSLTITKDLINSGNNMHGTTQKLFIYFTSDHLYQYNFFDSMYWEAMAHFINFTIQQVYFPPAEVTELEKQHHFATIYAGLCLLSIHA